MKTIKTLFFLFIALSLPISCNFDSIYQKAIDIPNKEWVKNKPVNFDIPINDTIHGFDITLNIRNTNDYPYSNLFLFITTVSPKGVTVKDTLEITLADEKGKWNGIGLGGIWSTEKKFKKNIRFPFGGVYRIEVTHAMRDDAIIGITDVGIDIERTR